MRCGCNGAWLGRAGVLCNDGTAEQIAGAGLIELLFQHMTDKKEDDEFVLQITFTFGKLLAHAPTCQCLLEKTDVVDYLVELLQDTNKEVCSPLALCCVRPRPSRLHARPHASLHVPDRVEQCERKLQVRKHADKALEALVRTDPAQAEMVMERKFETFNQEWLHFCEHPDDPAFALPHGGGSGSLWDGGPHSGGERITGSMAALDATLGREDLSDGSDDDLDASYLRI